MEFVLKVNKEKIINLIETKLKAILYYLYGWFVKDGEILGYILGVWHLLVCVTIFICIIISHTVYPIVWFQ